MLVRVREHLDTRYLEVPCIDEDEACRVAFRFVYKRRERDYSELANATYVPKLEQLSEDVARLMMSHVVN